MDHVDVFSISGGESGALTGTDYYFSNGDTRWLKMDVDGENGLCVYVLGPSSRCVAKNGAIVPLPKLDMLLLTVRWIEWAGLEVV